MRHAASDPVDAMLAAIASVNASQITVVVDLELLRSHLGQVWSTVSAVARGGGGGRDAPVGMTLLGAELARLGVPRAAAIASVRAALAPAWAHPTGEGPTADRDPRSARATLECIEFDRALLDAALAGFDAEASQDAPAEAPCETAFVDALLSGFFRSEDGIYARANAVGYVPGPTLALAVVVPAQSDRAPWLRETARDIAGAVARATEGPLRADPWPHVPILIDVEARQWDRAVADIEGQLPLGRVRVIALPPRAPLRIVELYQAVRPHLRLVVEANVLSKTIRASTALVFGYLAKAPVEIREAFIQEVFAPIIEGLSEPKHVELLGTLEAVFSEGSVPAAARRLFLHANTVRYRLRRIEQMLGVDLDLPSDRMMVEMAMSLRRLRGAR